MTTVTKNKTTHEICDEIAAHINSSQHKASSWYAGITQDAEQRLFVEHNVSRNDGAWIFRRASSSADARKIEQALLNWGCDGGTGGGGYGTVYVYAYVKTTNTIR